MRSVALELVTEFILDGTHGSPERTSDGVPVLSAQNVTNDGLNFNTDRLTSWAEYESFNRRIGLAVGDLLMTIVGTIGRAAVVDNIRPLVFQRSVSILRPKRSDLDERYFLHAVRDVGFQRQLASATNTSTQAGVYLGKIKKCTIPLPPLDEQRRIAAILDQAGDLRRKRREAHRLLTGLKWSIYTDVFGDPGQNPMKWPVSAISSLTAHSQYGTSEKAGPDGAYPILRMGNLTFDGGWALRDLKFIDLKPSDVPKYTVRAGDMLFNRTNSPDLVGKTAVFREVQPFAFAGYLVRLRTNELADVEYVSAYLNSKHGKATLRGMCKSIIGMANINAKELGTIRLPLPPIELQRDFANSMQLIREQESVEEAHLAELDRLFASLQHRAFNGEL